MNYKKDIWFKLLTLIEQANHLVKEGNWFDYDKSEFYNLKDTFLDFVIETNPDELETKLKYVPYYKYSNNTNNKAGELMRFDNNKMPFEHYLSLIEPCEHDIEISDKATIELEIICENRMFCFHIPKNKTDKWNLDYNSLPRKTWVSSKEFNKSKMNLIKQEINSMMKILNEKED